MPQHSDKSSGRLDKQTWLLLVVNGLFVTASALSGTFLGIYIWKASKDFILLGWFTLLIHVFMAITFWTAGYWAKKGQNGTCLRTGIGVSAVFYSIVLLLGKSAVHYVWLLGLVQGVAVGLFWLAFNVVYFEATDAGNRDRFNGLTGVMGSLVGMAAPWCAGYLISKSTGESGYRIMFMVSLGIFVAESSSASCFTTASRRGDIPGSFPSGCGRFIKHLGGRSSGHWSPKACAKASLAS